MALTVHRAERADRLAGALAEVLMTPPPDLFTADIVSVPTRGVERWLAQTLCTRLGTSDAAAADGVCAGIDFPFPGRLLGGALATATGVDPDEDPWRPERMLWPLLQVVDECLDEPFLERLKHHLGAPPRGRFPAVRRIARLLHRYQQDRPDQVLAWLAGEDPEDSAQRWQAELLRRLRARIGVPSPAERLGDAVQRIREQRDLLDLPDRLSFFGITRMSRSHLTVVAALSAQRDVGLFVLHPSPALWEAVAALGPQRTLPSRRDDPTRELASNRLLASWGRDVRELQLTLPKPYASVHHAAEPATDTLLQRLQAAITHDQPLPTGPKQPLAPEDRSVEIHACHGRPRQVEVLREAILHALAEDPTLEPRDIVVMCPDIEAYAPLISATFGTTEAGGGDLRVRLADRALHQANPLLGALSALLDLAASRLTVTELLDFAEREPVRRRFGFDDDAIARIKDWVGASGVRWGMDAERRAPWQMAHYGQGTWRAGLDRILTGVALAEMSAGPPLFAGVLPLDNVETGTIELAGRVAELLDRLDEILAALDDCRSLPEWSAALGAAARALFDTAPREAWQREELLGLLADLVQDAGAESVELDLGELRALLSTRLAGRPTRANFRTGHLTICTLVPMRSVPHRVVCVIGLDDGEFPRQASRDGDDITIHEPRVGEYDPRSEDRQMLLDALMAAGEKLIITYAGRDERRNLPRPPAVPVSELLDVIEQTVAPGEAPVRAQIERQHPLQPFDLRNFTLDAAAPSPWSFDPVALAGAWASLAPRPPRVPFLPNRLGRVEQEIIELAELTSFLESPAKAFLRQRLGVALPRELDEPNDALPVELDSLEQWSVGERLVQGLLAGRTIEECCMAEGARGWLPPGKLATRLLRELTPSAELLAAAAGPWLGDDAISYDIAVPIGERLLSGTVAGVRGEVLLEVGYGKMNARRRLRGWVRLLALSAAHPHTPFCAVSIGRASKQYSDLTVVTIPALGGDPEARSRTALRELGGLVDLLDRGRREPLPIACKTSAAWAEAARYGDDPRSAAEQQWKTPFQPMFGTKEDDEPEHRRLFGHGLRAPLEALLAELPSADESGPGWELTETTRFGRLARRLWDPLLGRERIEHR